MVSAVSKFKHWLCSTDLKTKDMVEYLGQEMYPACEKEYDTSLEMTVYSTMLTKFSSTCTGWCVWGALTWGLTSS
jgi:hypothetical protein